MKVSEIIVEQRKNIKESHVLNEDWLEGLMSIIPWVATGPGIAAQAILTPTNVATFGTTNSPSDWIYFGAQAAGRSQAEAANQARAYIDAVNSMDIATAGELARTYITDPEQLSIAFRELGIVQHVAKAPNVVANPSALQQIRDTASETVKSLAQKIKNIVGSKISDEQIAALARGFKKYALPAAAMVAVLYGGKKLYDYIKQNKKKRVAA
jgi:hypothetical protein